MAKITNELMQFAGRFEVVVSELSRRLTTRGTNLVQTVSQAALPANAWALDEIAAVLARLSNLFTVKIGGPRTIADVVAGNCYTYCNPTILERCRLAAGPEKSATIEIFSIEHFDHDPTDKEMEAEYIRRGLGRPDVDHAIHFGDQIRNLPVEGHPVIFYLKSPVSDADGSRFVLVLWRRGADRKLGWYWLSPGDRWGRCYLFAGVRE